VSDRRILRHASEKARFLGHSTKKVLIRMDIKTRDAPCPAEEKPLLTSAEHEKLSPAVKDRHDRNQEAAGLKPRAARCSSLEHSMHAHLGNPVGQAVFLLTVVGAGNRAQSIGVVVSETNIETAMAHLR